MTMNEIIKMMRENEEKKAAVPTAKPKPVVEMKPAPEVTPKPQPVAEVKPKAAPEILAPPALTVITSTEKTILEEIAAELAYLQDEHRPGVLRGIFNVISGIVNRGLHGQVMPKAEEESSLPAATLRIVRALGIKENIDIVAERLAEVVVEYEKENG